MKKAFRMREELDPAGKIAELDENEISVTSEELVGSIRPLIEQTKARLAQSVNSELVLLYWHIGRRINERLPAENRAEGGTRRPAPGDDRLALVGQRDRNRDGRGLGFPRTSASACRIGSGLALTQRTRSNGTWPSPCVSWTSASRWAGSCSV